MAEAGFEPMVTASALAKTVHALDRSATVTGIPPLIFENKERRLKMNSVYIDQIKLKVFCRYEFYFRVR
jgi:hypothetical protein